MENICVLLVSKILFIMHEPAGGQAIHVIQVYSFSFIAYHFFVSQSKNRHSDK